MLGVVHHVLSIQVFLSVALPGLCVPCRPPDACQPSLGRAYRKDVYFKRGSSGLERINTCYLLCILIDIRCHLLSLTHFFTGSLTHTHAHIHTQLQTAVQLRWYHTCALFPRQPGQWCSLLKAAGHTIIHFFFLARLMLTPLEFLYLWLSLAVLVFEGKYLSYRYVVAEGRERERATVRQEVRGMKCWEIAVLSEPRLIRAL